MRNFRLALVIFDEQIAAVAGTVQCSQGVKHIDHAESQCGCDKENHKSTYGMPFRVQVGGEVKALRKYLPERFGGEGSERFEGVEGEFFGKSVIKSVNRQPEQVIQSGPAEDSPEDRAFDLAAGQNRNQQKGGYGND
ncbi:unknown [Clostridium sp. CAG:448]|nr:unknown [Clostridium sp. CAG:448]